MKFGILLFLAFVSQQVFSQDETIKKLRFTAYGEFYYSFDFSNPPNHEKSDFLYNHKRHNELNANLALLKLNYLDKNYRANLGLMAGNYAQYNLSSEPTLAQFIYEANMGFKITKNNNIWLDAGIMPSHIGFESAISSDCWTLTRSMLAENSPYYETGIKLSYNSKNEKLYFAALLLNGWQKIRRPDQIRYPSFGTQLTYKPSEKIILNYSTFIGSDKPDNIQAIRYFHNFYLQYEPTSKFGIIAGFDIGVDKVNINAYGTWFSPVLIIRQILNDKTRIAFRAEYYNDPKQIIISSGTINGFQTLGLSSNIDLDINKRIKFRFEGKIFNSKDKIFSNNKNDNYSLTTNMTFKL